jgi:hypothetical protein
VSALADIAQRHTATCDLFSDAIRRFGSQQLKAGGNSMRPAIWPGDRLVIESAESSDLAIGDVVACRRHGSIVAHRVVATSNRADGVYIITRGDRLRSNDEPCALSDVIGRVTSIRRGPFRFDPARATGLEWRAASYLLEGALTCRRLLSVAWHRGRVSESWAPMRAS